MKRFAIVIAILPVLAFATACGTATAPITGKYSTTIFEPVSVQGTYTLIFKKNGTGDTEVNGQPTAHTFTFKGSTLTSPGGGPNVCPTVGTYKIHLDGKHLTLTVIHDPCTIGRGTNPPWTHLDQSGLTSEACAAGADHQPSPFPQSRSGRPDSNRRPLVPQTNALTRLRHAPQRGKP
jgi:hypothetical protein